MEDPKMFQSYTNKSNYSSRVKHDIREVINNFTSKDMENTPLESGMRFRMNFMSGIF